MLKGRLITNLITSSPLSHLPKYSIRYSRQYFQELDQDHEALQKIRKQQQQRQLEETLFNNKANEKNPNNTLKNIKIATPINYPRIYDQKNEVHQCAILIPEPPKPKNFLYAQKQGMQSSIKKTRLALLPVRKKHILQAIDLLEKSPKKIGRLIKPTFQGLINQAMRKNIDPLRLFIHGCIIGKQKRYKSIRYHAKFKRGMQTTDFIKVKVIAQEMNEQEFYEKVGTGKAAPGYAAFIRRRLIGMNAPYEKLVEYSGVTTSKGRQQKREMMKRRVDRIMLNNKEQGKFVPKFEIQREEAAKEASKFRQLFYSLYKDGSQSSLERRELLYKKNLGID